MTSNITRDQDFAPSLRLASWKDTLALLMYDDVHTADSPKAAMMEFLQSTYDAAADAEKWDRKALER